MASSLFGNQNQLSNMINSQVINQAKSIMGNMQQVRGILGIINGKGMNAEQAVRNICKEKGINVDEFMSMLK